MESSGITPIFIFSLLRSGSTLLLRMLNALPQISSIAEPHILLPLIYTLKPRTVYAEYSHELVTWATEDLCRHLDGGQSAYEAAIRHFALELYESASSTDARYFVDKTPSYSLIASEVIRIFPDARFIFLWRNPLAVAASICSTWRAGKWFTYQYRAQLYQGLSGLANAYQANRTCSLALRYEDLVTYPAETVTRLSDYLDISLTHFEESDFSASVPKGRLNDPYAYSSSRNEISSQYVQKWTKILNNPLRKAWSRRYLRWIGEERLAIMGYDLQTLLKEIESVSTSMEYVLSDLYRMPYGYLYPLSEYRIFRHKLEDLREGRPLYSHT